MAKKNKIESVKVSYNENEEDISTIEKTSEVEVSDSVVEENYEKLMQKSSGLVIKDGMVNNPDHLTDEVEENIKEVVTDLNYMSLENLVNRLSKLARAAEKESKYALAGEFHNLNSALATALNKLNLLSKEALNYRPIID